MALIRPRLTDYHGIMLAQDEIDFVIPFLDEDIPFCVDPFLLWKSPSQQDNALHVALLDSFNYLGHIANRGNSHDAVHQLIRASECNEIGLGFSSKREGVRIGKGIASKIVSLFTLVPQLKSNGFSHIEEIQLFVDQISKDRISDITCSLLKSFLIDYTIEQCRKYNIPIVDVQISDVYNQRTHSFSDSEKVTLPVNPESSSPILLVPKRWLRRIQWITCEDYAKNYFLEKALKENEECPSKGEILLFNRNNYGIVQAYIREKERSQADCKNDPLFLPIPILSAKRKLDEIKKLPTGKDQNADSKYEDLICQLISSLIYPHLDFAAEQSRTDSGVLIRDLVFYNNRSVDFLKDIYESYDCRQIIMEIKNVKSIEREHVNQLNRYLSNEFGKFGILITRNSLSRAMFKNTVDLWAGQRRCIITLTDTDIELMVDVFESKQRNPIEVIKKKYVEFIRACPA